MTDSEYLEEMIVLTTRLTDASNNFGLRSPEYNAVLKEISASAARFNRSRHVSSVVMRFVYVSAILFVLYLVYCVLCEAFEWGPR